MAKNNEFREKSNESRLKVHEKGSNKIPKSNFHLKKNKEDLFNSTVQIKDS